MFQTPTDDDRGRRRLQTLASKTILAQGGPVIIPVVEIVTDDRDRLSGWHVMRTDDQCHCYGNMVIWFYDLKNWSFGVRVSIYCTCWRTEKLLRCRFAVKPFADKWNRRQRQATHNKLFVDSVDIVWVSGCQSIVCRSQPDILKRHLSAAARIQPQQQWTALRRDRSDGIARDLVARARTDNQWSWRQTTVHSTRALDRSIAAIRPTLTI